MRIIGVGFHTTYQYELAQLGADYRFDYIFSIWDHANRPQPPNVRLLKRADPLSHYDLILAHCLQDLWDWRPRIQSQRAQTPLVISFHTYPPHWDECNAALPAPLHQLTDMLRGVQKVFISPGARALWGFRQEPDSTEIPHAIDGQRWRGYRGDNPTVLTVCNLMWEQDRYRGGSLFDLVTDGLPTRVIGDNPGRSARASSAEALQEAYRAARVFLWTGLRGPPSFAPLEAMATGMPIVTVWTPDWAQIIEDGENGFLCHDPMTMRARCQQLLADHDLARRIGARARDTVLARFAPDRFRQRWRQVFARAAGRDRSA